MVAYDPNLDGTRVWGIFHIADGRDDRNCIPGERYCVSSFGGGQRRNTGKKQEPGQAGGRAGGVGDRQPALQHGLVFPSVSSGVRLPGFGSWLYC